MFRHSLFGFGALLILGPLALTAAAALPTARPKARPAVLKPAAAPITMPDGSPIVMKPHGGVILPNVEVQTVFLGDWSSPANQTLKGQLNGAVDTIVTGAYLDALTPYYGVRHGTHDSTVSIPKNFVDGTLSQADLQTLLVGAISGGPLKPLDANRLYLFYVPPGVSVPGLAATNAGSHVWFYNGSQAISYAVVNTSASLVGATSVTSHEIAEGVTDPTGQGYFDDSLANEPQEIADFTDGPVIDGKQYPYLGATLKGVNIQLVLDPNGNVIQVPGATVNPASSFTPLRKGVPAAKPPRR